MSNEEIKAKIQKLVDKYDIVASAGRLKKYSEEDTKKDFILPLFRILGWDVDNREEVSSEESIKSSGRVDYGFYLDERPKFYLEAKSLKADLHKEEFARQAIRYSWNKGVTWAILTDFESLKVFNAQNIKGSLHEKLFFEIPYQKYLERFDQLWFLSREAFRQDLIDKEAERVGKKLIKISVSVSLYEDLNECRDILTHELAAWNEKINPDLLDEGVQRLLDRLIFIRVTEDRDLEPSTLRPLVNAWKALPAEKRNQTTIYQSMVETFRKFDQTYNSNLFQPHPFEKWEEHSGVTEKVIEKLYGKPGYYDYDFKVIPADVLGAVYENYLGHRLAKAKKELTLQKDAKKRKEQGIYYTPPFIVDYIVKHALEPVLVKCKTFPDLAKIKILDPACGSGSFLVKALEVLSNRYRKITAQEGTAVTKLGFLQQNIYGVDLDSQAVEIARLNLLLAALDERTKLPLLSENIKHGNSLISGTDEELKKYFGKNFREKHPFDWQGKFHGIFEHDGFDVIIGNPPYIFARGGSFTESEKKYYYNKFKLQRYQINTYLLFIEKAFQLLKEGGHFGFIIPNNWLTINSFAKFREFILKNVGGVKIINAVDTVFSQASVDTCILIFEKTKPTTVRLGELVDGKITALKEYKPDDFYQNDFIINLEKVKTETDGGSKLLMKFRECLPLGDIADVKSGLVAYEVGKGSPPQTKEMKDNRVYHSEKRTGDDWFKYLDGVDVRRFVLRWSGEYIKYGKNLAAPRKKNLFEGKRILVRQIPSSPPYCINAAYTEEKFINDRNSNNILNPKSNYDLKYILGVINSRLISYWFAQTFNKFSRKIFPQFKVNELAQFPIYPANKEQQKTIIDLVNRILRLNKELEKSEPGSDQHESTKKEIEKTDKKIDAEVYKLYDLTPEEIDIVEKDRQR